MRFTLLIIIILNSVVGISQTESDSIVERQVIPSDTDPLINLWNSDSHYVYTNPTALPINKLFVFLPGSFAIPQYYKAISKKAANLGYHSINLRYPNSWSMLGECGNTTDVNCHYNLRTEVFYGTDTYSGITVNSVNSIKNRLVKLLLYLDTNYPTENWGQYLDITNEPIWNLIAIGGHSQGGGYGSLVGIDNQLFKILNFASNDYSFYYNQPANWYSFPKVTTPDKYFGMVHSQDGLTQYLEMMTALGVDTSLAINIDTSSTPYNNSHILFTNEVPSSGIAWVDNHNSVVVDFSTPLDVLGNYIFDEVWQYLLSNDTVLGLSNFENSNNQNFDVNVYPNPFSGTTTIDFHLQQNENVSIKIIDNQGKIIQTLVANKIFNVGKHSVQWNRYNTINGIFYIQISIAKGFQKSLKVVITE